MIVLVSSDEAVILISVKFSILFHKPKFRPESGQIGSDNKGRLVPAGIVLLGKWGS